MLEELKRRARALKHETFALYLAAKHPATPWYAKVILVAVVAYAFSPIDLIPDFIPFLGYLDDLILLPAGIALAVKLTPASVMTECRAAARDAFADGKPVSRGAAAVIVVIWVALAVLFVAWIARLVRR